MNVKETGGARVGYNAILSINFSKPFGSLEAYEDRIELSYMFGTIVFPKQHVKQIEYYSGLFSTGIRIKHDLSRVPKLAVFWSRNVENLMTGLRKLGFPVDNPH